MNETVKTTFRKESSTHIEQNHLDIILEEDINLKKENLISTEETSRDNFFKHDEEIIQLNNKKDRRKSNKVRKQIIIEHKPIIAAMNTKRTLNSQDNSEEIIRKQVLTNKDIIPIIQPQKQNEEISVLKQKKFSIENHLLNDDIPIEIDYSLNDAFLQAINNDFDFTETSSKASGNYSLMKINEVVATHSSKKQNSQSENKKKNNKEKSAPKVLGKKKENKYKHKREDTIIKSDTRDDQTRNKKDPMNKEDLLIKPPKIAGREESLKLCKKRNGKLFCLS